MRDKNQAFEEVKLLREAVIRSVAIAREADSNYVKLAMDILLAGTSQLGTIFQQRCSKFGNMKSSRTKRPSKSDPQNGPQQQKHPPSSTNAPKTQNAVQKRPEELSSIQRGIRQADPSLADRQRALRRKVYGAQNDEVEFQKAAKAIAR